MQADTWKEKLNSKSKYNIGYYLTPTEIFARCGDSSMGPEIYELYIEDGKIHIKCSLVQNITVHTGSRRSRSRWAYGDECLTEAKFGMTPEDGYVRFSITDKNGKSAHTRAYFWDEIFAE